MSYQGIDYTFRNTLNNLMNNKTNNNKEKNNIINLDDTDKERIRRKIFIKL